jgi:hypothetical protein
VHAQTLQLAARLGSSIISTAAALAAISAAVSFTDLTANILVLAGAPQVSAVPALILGLLDHALPNDHIARERCGGDYRKSEDAHAGSYHHTEDNRSHNLLLEFDEPAGPRPTCPSPTVCSVH